MFFLMSCRWNKGHIVSLAYCIQYQGSAACAYLEVCGVLHIGTISGYLNAILFLPCGSLTVTSLQQGHTCTNTHTHIHRVTHVNHLHPFCWSVNRLLAKVTAKAHTSTSIPTQELLFLSFHVTILNGPLCCQRSYYAQQIIRTALADLQCWSETKQKK